MPGDAIKWLDNNFNCWVLKKILSDERFVEKETLAVKTHVPNQKPKCCQYGSYKGRFFGVGNKLN